MENKNVNNGFNGINNEMNNQQVSSSGNNVQQQAAGFLQKAIAKVKANPKFFAAIAIAFVLGTIIGEVHAASSYEKAAEKAKQEYFKAVDEMVDSFTDYDFN